MQTRGLVSGQIGTLLAVFKRRHAVSSNGPLLYSNQRPFGQWQG